MARLIFIHGGCHGPWCWDRILEPLARAGHTVETVELPGRGHDAHLATSLTLDDWVKHVGEVIDAGPTPAFIVAHSMGGLTASQLAERRPAAIARVVYVAALVPADGETGMAAVQRLGPESLLPTAMEFSADGRLVEFSADRVGPLFYNRCSDEDVAWARARMCPEVTAALTTPMTLSREHFGQVAKTYIVTTDDNILPTNAQQVMARAIGADAVVVDSDHSPFVSAVDELVKAIDDATG